MNQNAVEVTLCFDQTCTFNLYIDLILYLLQHRSCFHTKHFQTTRKTLDIDSTQLSRSANLFSQPPRCQIVGLSPINLKDPLRVKEPIRKGTPLLKDLVFTVGNPSQGNITSEGNANLGASLSPDTSRPRTRSFNSVEASSDGSEFPPAQNHPPGQNNLPGQGSLGQEHVAPHLRQQNPRQRQHRPLGHPHSGTPAGRQSPAYANSHSAVGHSSTRSGTQASPQKEHGEPHPEGPIVCNICGIEHAAQEDPSKSYHHVQVACGKCKEHVFWTNIFKCYCSDTLVLLPPNTELRNLDTPCGNCLRRP